MYYYFPRFTPIKAENHKVEIMPNSTQQVIYKSKFQIQSLWLQSYFHLINLTFESIT